ncbi:MAG: alpha/beta fold hydrolase [Hyphomicrobium sp.]
MSLHLAPNTLSRESESIFFIQRNGLRLHAAHYYPTSSFSDSSVSFQRPLICLPGLTRNTKDFDALAQTLSSGHKPRHVYALDSRGRGLSEHDPDWRNYNVITEMQDVIDFIFTYGLEKSAILGTSRGGLIAMFLAAAQPSILGPILLNDIGPIIDIEGLSRIALYVGRTPLPHSWSDAANLIKKIHMKSFPALPETEWAGIAKQLFNENNGRPSPAYDANLSYVISEMNKDPPPKLWDQFEALKPFPLMVMRGSHSDILSQETVAEMRLRHPNMIDIIVEGQGHAPWLRDKETITEIRHFLETTDRFS